MNSKAVLPAAATERTPGLGEAVALPLPEAPAYPEDADAVLSIVVVPLLACCESADVVRLATGDDGEAEEKSQATTCAVAGERVKAAAKTASKACDRRTSWDSLQGDEDEIGGFMV